MDDVRFKRSEESVADEEVARLIYMTSLMEVCGSRSYGPMKMKNGVSAVPLLKPG